MQEDAIGRLLAIGRRRAAVANDAVARDAYLAVLRHDPTYLQALLELGALAYAGGHRAAAHTAFAQAVRCHPDDAGARLHLGDILFAEGDHAAARSQYEMALRAAPHSLAAHRGLARALAALGAIEAATSHWRTGFAGCPTAVQPYRGPPPGIPVLLLVSAKGGNIPTRHFLDDRVFAVTALYVEFHDPALPLPPHAIVFNAIGDADLCGVALAGLPELLSRTTAPVINPPTRVRRTGRLDNARRFVGLQGVRVPWMRRVTRAALADTATFPFPLLLRAVGYHTGQHFLRVEAPEEMAAALATLPGNDLLAIAPLEARGTDGMARKYRVMVIDGALHPLHLAISAYWKVHYFTADVAPHAERLAEERRFLDDMPAVLGSRAMSALTQIAAALGLDYAGVDFGLGPDGTLLLFEANATMVVNPPDPDPIWDYRRPAITAALEAAARMVAHRARQPCIEELHGAGAIFRPRCAIDAR